MFEERHEVSVGGVAMSKGESERTKTQVRLSHSHANIT